VVGECLRHQHLPRSAEHGLVKIQSRDVAYEHYGRDYTEEENPNWR